MRGSTVSSFHSMSSVQNREGAVLTRLRILHTESSLGWGGQELRVLNEAAGMEARGHEVTIAAPAESRILSEARVRGLKHRCVPIARKTLAGVLSVRRLILELQPTIVNSHSSVDSWLCALASSTLRTAPPIVRTRHISASIPRNIASRWLYTKATSRVVTTGESLREQVVRETRLDGGRVFSVPTGIDLEIFSPGDRAEARRLLGLPPQDFIVGIVATLRSWKGHRYLLDSVASLPDDGLHLVVVGSGPGRDNLAEQARKLSISGRVTFAGEQSNVASWLRSFDVFVLPSYANEGVPQAIMQAMACGIPVISTAVGAIPEIVRNDFTGVIVPARDPAAIAGAITRLRGDSSLLRRFSEAGRREALERFSAVTMLDRMEKIFLEASDSRMPC